MESIDYYLINQRLPIHRVSILEDLSINDSLRESITKIGDEMKHQTNVKASMSNWFLHHSGSDFAELSSLALKEARKLGTIGGQVLQTHECWCASYSQGDFAVAHTHWPNLWSWCYYVDVPPGSSPLVFPDVCDEMMGEEKGLEIFPKQGELIIFPGWLKHSVPVCEVEEVRRMVAGNIKYQTFEIRQK